MPRKSLVNVVSDHLLSQIVDGRLPADAGLPSEADIGIEHDVSRVTVREAIKTLQAQGVVRIENGRGSYVNPVSEWTSLDAVLRVSSAATSDRDTAIQLVELRRMFETGVAALAAERRTTSDLAALSELLDEMRQAHTTHDVASFVASDLAFHNVIMKASGNVFVRVMFEPLSRVLAQKREETSRIPIIQQHAIAEHTHILDALTVGDPEKARQAMDHHMIQTLDDLRQYVLLG